MITINKSTNFPNWFDVRLFGVLVDNAKTHAKALRVAHALKTQNALDGKTLSIVNK